MVLALAVPATALTVAMLVAAVSFIVMLAAIAHAVDCQRDVAVIARRLDAAEEARREADRRTAGAECVAERLADEAAYWREHAHLASRLSDEPPASRRRRSA